MPFSYLFQLKPPLSQQLYEGITMPPVIHCVDVCVNVLVEQIGCVSVLCVCVCVCVIKMEKESDKKCNAEIIALHM